MAADETSGGQPDAPPEPPREEEGAPPAPQPAAVADDDVDGSASAASDEPPEEEEEIEWTPNAKLKRIAEIDFAEQPASYRSNTKKEELTLEYVENFNRQYVDLYPSRAPLLLAPLNECGVPKFICTTVRPTKLPYKLLYDFDKCAHFVADYVTYEPLELPTHLPRHMPSPSAVLRWQAGDCFDVSILLCSLLLGVGYDAYVVYGYAHKKTTQCNQTKAAVSADSGAEVGQQAEGGQENKYRLPRRPPLESKFLKEQEAEAAAEEEARKRSGGVTPAPPPLPPTADGHGPPPPPPAAGPTSPSAGAEDEDDEEEMDELRGRRIHAWVLLLAGKRQLDEHFFLEPSTGACVKLEGSVPYYGVEAIFNAANLWVNMQGTHVHGPQISWDLQDTDKWEHVLVDSTAPSALDALAALEEGEEEVVDEGDEEDEAAVAAAAADSAAEGGAPGAPAADGAEPAASPAAPSPAAGGGAAEQAPPTPKASAAAASGGGGAGAAAGAAAGGGGGGGGAAGDNGAHADTVGPDNELDMPPSWVRRLALTPAEFESRCPGRTKEVRFKKGILHTWAPYARKDALVRRLTLYDDAPCTDASEIHETFEHRKDRLVSRVTRVTTNEVVEQFLPGRPFGLKEHRLVTGNASAPGKLRVLTFYPAARLDGLLERTDEFGVKTIERYVGRDDRLVYRSVTFDEASAGAPRDASDADPVIVKMTEKYARDEAIPAEADVAKRVFALRAQFIQLYFHHGEGRITASTRTFSTETGQATFTLVDPFAKKPQNAALHEEFQALISAERDCMQAYREQERQMKDILAKRKEEEADWQLLVSVYDTARNRQYLDADRKEDAAAAATQHDYLTPFLPNPKSSEPLDKDTALRVREACLKSLRDRLVERATIIQSRLDEEHANLAKRTSTFSRNRDHQDKATEEDYERYCQAAMFRIQIIDDRLKRHEKQALLKYEEMDARLRADPRMRAIHY